MKIVVFGSNGQVGNELKRADWPASADLVFLTRKDVDLSSGSDIVPVIEKLSPDWVINASAYTAVDKAETESELAHQINDEAPYQMALACENLDIPFLTISTDYVFDGEKETPYLEDDEVCPLGVYGASKVKGEQRVREACTKHIILRTAWVYSAFGGNFLKTMLRLGAERDELGIVADQRGCPTSANSIARAISSLVAAQGDIWGTYHYCDDGEATWYDFANQIFDYAEQQGKSKPKLNAIATSDYPTPAKRPANSRLNCEKIDQVLGFARPAWQAETLKVIKELSEQ